MNKFTNGDEVTDGTRKGVIGDSFYYGRSDDGTMNKPGENVYPCQWEDGTQGYRHASNLEYA